MSGVALGIVFQAAILVSGSQPYAEAFNEAASNGQPLLVLVGADWCPGCVTMKQTVLPRLVGNGRLRRVNYTTVNIDEHSELAYKLMQGRSLPQLIVYARTRRGWHRDQITGPTSEEGVAQLLDKAVAAQESPENQTATAITETKKE